MSVTPPITAVGLEPAWEVALLFPPQGEWSVHDYLGVAQDSNRLVEFNQGCIEVHDMPTIAHQRILRFLFVALSAFVNDRQLGEVLFAALPLRLGDDKFREPDIVFINRDRTANSDEVYLRAADLIIEVVSNDPKSRHRDLVTKRKEYAAAGVPEYWIVDPQENRLTVLSLDGDAYVVHGEFTPGQQATSRLLEGFAVDVAATFQAAEGGV